MRCFLCELSLQVLFIPASEHLLPNLNDFYQHMSQYGGPNPILHDLSCYSYTHYHIIGALCLTTQILERESGLLCSAYILGPFLNFFNLFFIFWPRCAACAVLVPQPGIKPVTPAVETQSINHWTTREIPWFPFKRYPLLVNLAVAREEGRSDENPFL